MRTSPFRIAIIVLMFLNSSLVYGQNYPDKPIKVLTPGSGGGADFVARLIAPGLAVNLGRPVLVENHPNGVIPGALVSKASPDGYTLLLSSSPLWIGPLLRKTPYDPLKDFSPITFVAESPHVLVVTPTLPVKTVGDLVALAKSKPGLLNYSAASTGSSTHLAAELFKALAHVDIVRISYSKGALQVGDLIKGRVQLSFGIAGAVSPHIRSGQLKALAVTSAGPSQLFPNLPTVAATVPGFESGSDYGLFAPARTPQPIIDRLQRETVRVLTDKNVKEKFFSAGIEAAGSTPKELDTKIRSEMARMAKVIKDAGITANK